MQHGIVRYTKARGEAGQRAERGGGVDRDQCARGGGLADSRGGAGALRGVMGIRAVAALGSECRDAARVRARRAGRGRGKPVLVCRTSVGASANGAKMSGRRARQTRRCCRSRRSSRGAPGSGRFCASPCGSLPALLPRSCCSARIRHCSAFRRCRSTERAQRYPAEARLTSHSRSCSNPSCRP